jgi:TonB family protein
MATQPRLFCMKLRLVVLILQVASALHLAAQSSESLESVTGVVELTKLVTPIYPRLALQARITGDVDVTVAIRRDGSVESARLVDGHPMLTEAALNSARRSKFEGRGCTEAVKSYALKYKFRITSRGYPRDCDSFNDQPPAPELDLARREVAVSGWAQQICDPSGSILKVRSAKCLYLWRCSTRYGP